MKELDKLNTESRVWQYFRLMLPTTRERLKEQYTATSERMKPRATRPSNSKGEFLEMREFYHALLEANPVWAFKYLPPPKPHSSKPNKWKPRRLARDHDFAEFKSIGKGA